MHSLSSLKAVLTAIQNDCLVLETDDHKIIHWPIKNLEQSQSFKIGKEVTIELKNNDEDKEEKWVAQELTKNKFEVENSDRASMSSNRESVSMLASSNSRAEVRTHSEDHAKQQKLCKMLEDLVN